MRMPSAAQRRSLERATSLYQKHLDLAQTYLQQRGIDPETAERWRLGVVFSPEPGHEQATGRLVIPYTNRLGVVALKFRCLVGHDCKSEKCPKYINPLGQESYLFNVLATESSQDCIHICEGELDCIVLSEVLGEPTIGLPGATNWKPHYPWHVKGFERVLVWPDGDKAGRDLANLVRREIPSAEVAPMPDGYDVSSLYSELGAEALRKLAGAEDE